MALRKFYFINVTYGALSAIFWPFLKTNDWFRLLAVIFFGLPWCFQSRLCIKTLILGRDPISKVWYTATTEIYYISRMPLEKYSYPWKNPDRTVNIIVSPENLFSLRISLSISKSYDWMKVMTTWVIQNYICIRYEMLLILRINSFFALKLWKN